MSPRRVLSALLVAAAAAVLAGCSPTVNMTPAPPDANNPACADVIVRLPDDVGGFPKRTTDAQSTAAWGEPTALLLYCGVPVPGPSELPCVAPGDIHWLVEEVDAGFAFTTYGRDPAVRLVVDNDVLGTGVALREVASAVSTLPSNGRECLDIQDAVPTG